MLGHDAQGEAGLSKKLGRADDSDKEAFSGEGLGALDAGLGFLELIVLDVVVESSVGDAVTIVLVRGFRWCLLRCWIIRGREGMWRLVKRRVVLFMYGHCCG